MSDINEIIIKKLSSYPEDVQKLCLNALKLAELGIPEISIAEQLNSVVRKIAKQGSGE